MSTVVRGVGASHSTLMNTHGPAPGNEERAARFTTALEEAARIVAADGADLAVVVGPNHFRGLWLDLMPAFTIGVGEVEGSGESGTPGGPLLVDAPAARRICAGLVRREFDLAFSNRLQVDHGVTQPMQLVLGTGCIPVVPLLVNVFAPPLPALSRCLDLGAALAEAIGELPGSRRVVVIASGGLSHTLPWPDWRSPHGEDEAFMVEAWSAGRERWRDYEARRRQLVVRAPARIDEGLDNELLDGFAGGALDSWRRRDDELIERGGNGASEWRSWLVMAAATAHRGGRRLAYEPMEEWLTGMGVAVSAGADDPASAGADDPAGAAPDEPASAGADAPASTAPGKETR